MPADRRDAAALGRLEEALDGHVTALVADGLASASIAQAVAAEQVSAIIPVAVSNGCPADAAIAGLLFQAALRRSEVVTLEWRDIEAAGDAPGAFRIRVRSSKTNQDGAAAALAARPTSGRATRCSRAGSRGMPGAMSTVSSSAALLSASQSFRASVALSVPISASAAPACAIARKVPHRDRQGVGHGPDD